MPLQKAPRGILELLRLRTLGDNQNKFSDTLDASVDATNFYGADLQVVSTDSLVGAITRTVTSVATVPGRILGLSGICTIGAAAGTRLSMRISYAPNPSANPVVLGFDTRTPVIGADFAVVAAFSTPIVFLPGARWDFTTQGDAAGADHQQILRCLFEQYTGS